MTKMAITIAEAQQISGISRSRLYEEIKAGKITPRKNGTRTLILADDFKNYLASLPLANLQAA